MNKVHESNLPVWVRRLDEGDLHFVKQMVLASGSLKQLAKEYGVSYPTIRQRLNRIIDRIQLYDANTEDSPFEGRVRVLVAEKVIEPGLGKELLELHRNSQES